ncbi:MAG: response regulator [Candidatus Omnitrophota bacterium]
MKILIADDDPTALFLLQENLTEWGFDIALASDGNEAWNLIQQTSQPQIAILDWIMPGMNGLEICSRLRQEEKDRYIYILLLTSKNRCENIVQGLEAGADDYIIKPFDALELKARIATGKRIIELQDELLQVREKQNQLILELTQALENVKTLSGLIPICAWCKKIRDDEGYWNRVEEYLTDHSDAKFTHSICPECKKQLCGERDFIKK